MNEYLKLFNNVQGNMSHGQMHRNKLVNKYSWAVPTEPILNEILKYSPLIEIGAGLGYWASLLQLKGADILPFDDLSWDHDGNKPWCEIKKGDYTEINNHPKRMLFLCWAPYGEDMAYNCVKTYTGKHVLWVGEGQNGCNGTEEFHEYMTKNFKQIKVDMPPRWYNMWDSFVIFERRDNVT